MSWGAEEELLLLESVEVFGWGNWTDVAEHVATKTPEQCEDHYKKIYTSREDFLPDTKNILTTKENVHTMQNLEAAARPPSPTLPRPVNHAQPNDPPKPKIDENGFMVNRNEFEVEWNNEAEFTVKDIEFLEDDTPEDVELKHKMLEVFGRYQVERGKRRDFILSHNLLTARRAQQQDRRRPKSDKDIYGQTRAFLQFLDEEQYEDFVQGLITERAIRQRIAELKEYRTNGIKTLAEAEIFDLQKKRRETEKSLKRAREGAAYLYDERKARTRRQGGGDFQELEHRRGSGRKSSPLDLEGQPGLELLSENEKQICSTLRLLPKQYLLVKEALLKENNENGFLRKGHARSLIRMDVNKTSKLYDFFESAGWVQAEPTQ